MQIKTGGRTGLINQNLLDTAMFVDNDSSQSTLFIETAKLSELFFEQLKQHPVPLDENAIKLIANNSSAIDVYCWLAYRLHSLTWPKLVTWKALHAQFGRNSPQLSQFKYYFKQVLELSLAVYPEAKASADDRGLTLNPSKPPVSPKAASAGVRRLKA